MEELTFERFFELRNTLQAFTVGDIQRAGVLLHWSLSNGFSAEELLGYVTMSRSLMQLESIGYFNKVHTPEQAKEIRKFESTLTPEFRKEVRRVRFSNSHFGPVLKLGG